MADVDALALAMREPELFGMAEYLLFPERKLLSRIVFLYNWKMFNEITHQQTAELRDMLNGKSDDMSASTPEYSVPAGSTIASEFPRELVDEDIDDEDDVDIRQENGRVKSFHPSDRPWGSDWGCWETLGTRTFRSSARLGGIRDSSWKVHIEPLPVSP